MTRRTVLVLALVLSGCGGAAAPDPRAFDLGLNPPAVALPAVRVGSVRAIPPFEATDMHYRLAYRNAAEIAAFANSRWAATPAEMFRKQLLRAASDRPGKCRLDVEVQEFTQVFASKDSSEARLELRAWLGSASRSLTIAEADAGPGAASGAAAFARAADRAIGELARWIAAQPDCR